MPKTFTVTTYKYSELSDEAKAKARDWFREASIGDDCYSDAVIDDAMTIAPLMGLTINPRNQKYHVAGRDGKPGRDGIDTSPAVYWSGFSSQGDGACFEGSWSAASAKDAEKRVKSYAGCDKELHRIAAEFERIAKAYPEASFTVKQSGHDYHSRCTDFDVDFGDDIQLPETELDKAENDLIEAARDFMDWIYKQLEAANDYEQKDETVAENIEANEYDFTEEGKRTVVLNVD